MPDQNRYGQNTFSRAFLGAYNASLNKQRLKQDREERELRQKQLIEASRAAKIKEEEARKQKQLENQLKYTPTFVENYSRAVDDARTSGRPEDWAKVRHMNEYGRRMQKAGVYSPEMQLPDLSSPEAEQAMMAEEPINPVVGEAPVGRVVSQRPESEFEDPEAFLDQAEIVPQQVTDPSLERASQMQRELPGQIDAAIAQGRALTEPPEDPELGNDQMRTRFMAINADNPVYGKDAVRGVFTPEMAPDFKKFYDAENAAKTKRAELSGTKLNIDRPDSPRSVLGKASDRAVQADETLNVLDRLEEMSPKDAYGNPDFTDFLSYRGLFKNKAMTFAEKLEILSKEDLSAEERQQFETAQAFYGLLKRFGVEEFKYFFGSAQTAGEAKRAVDALLNTSMSPTQFAEALKQLRISAERIRHVADVMSTKTLVTPGSAEFHLLSEQAWDEKVMLEKTAAWQAGDMSGDAYQKALESFEKKDAKRQQRIDVLEKMRTGK